MSSLRRVLTGFVFAFLSLSLLGTAWAQAAKEPKVVYHVDSAGRQVDSALDHIRNQLITAPNTKIVVVALADGIAFLLKGAQDAANVNGNTSYAVMVEQLKARGVRFEVCENAMRGRRLTKEQFIPQADFTPAGIVSITHWQSVEGYAYFKP
jgi:intracellular sulfur oxidation DsrE/DsrF family protein